MTGSGARKRGWRLLQAIAVVGLGAAGVAFATVTLGSNAVATTVIQACANPGNGNLRLVANNQTDCHSGETAVSWNVQGSKGDPGTAGAAGRPGADGTGVTSRTLTAGDVNCPNGGAEFFSASPQPSFACNGAPGKDGTDGKNGTNGTNGADGQGITIASFTGALGPCTDGGTKFTAGNQAPGYACNGALATTSMTTSTSMSTSTTTTTNCTAPAYPNGTVVCNGNGSFTYACNDGFADLDGNLANGCEVDLLTDVHNCGTPGNDVTSLPNATGGCVNGSAVILACNAGFFDNDLLVSDGCESTGPACAVLHQNGVGQTYTDCSLRGSPGVASTYTLTMATDARQAAEAFFDSSSVSPPFESVFSCGASSQAVALSYLTGFYVIWVYSGPLAGHVHMGTDGGLLCPVAGDPVWN